MVTRQKILFQANTQKHVRPEADTTINQSQKKVPTHIVDKLRVHMRSIIKQHKINKYFIYLDGPGYI